MKKQLCKSIICLLVTFGFYATQMCHAHIACSKQLSRVTHHLFTECCPEYTALSYHNDTFLDHIKAYPTQISATDFLDTIQQLTICYKQELKQKKYWQNAYEHNLTIDNKDAVLGFIGDLHGAYPTLIRQMTQLKDVSHLFLLGDYTNRGPYGVEVWYTLAHLKMNNWHNVFLLKGNHENITVNALDPKSGGFLEEIKQKFGKKAPEIIKTMKELYQVLPLNITLNFNGKNISIRHGGINPLEKKNNPKSKKVFETVDTKKQYETYYGYEGYNCGHFTTNKKIRTINYKVRKIAIEPDNSSGYGFIAGPQGTRQYMNEKKLDLIIHGHQHDFWGPWILNEHKKDFIYLKNKQQRTMKKSDMVLTICSCPTHFGFDYEASAKVHMKDKELIVTINKTDLPDHRCGKFIPYKAQTLYAPTYFSQTFLTS